MKPNNGLELRFIIARLNEAHRFNRTYVQLSIRNYGIGSLDRYKAYFGDLFKEAGFRTKYVYIPRTKKTYVILTWDKLW
jgi:hypothetical protein